MLNKEQLEAAAGSIAPAAPAAPQTIARSSVERDIEFAVREFDGRQKDLMRASSTLCALQDAASTDKTEFTPAEIAEFANAAKDPHVAFLRMLSTLVSSGVGGPVASGVELAKDGDGGILMFRFGSFLPAPGEITQRYDKMLAFWHANNAPAEQAIGPVGSKDIVTLSENGPGYGNPAASGPQGPAGVTQTELPLDVGSEPIPFPSVK